jgi:hypothetical protein
MSWTKLHAESERLAAEGEEASRRGEHVHARSLYAQAAEAEARGLDFVDPGKRRTAGICSVSTVSLWFKAQEYVLAQQTAYKWLSKGWLPEFAVDQLKSLLQETWNEAARAKAGLKFLPGQINVSVSGGEVIAGGAPLDLVVNKVQTVQSYFYRTVEYLKGLPLRKRGFPDHEIQEMCRPWLFQSSAGSYQFAVAIQDPRQLELKLFEEERPKAVEVAQKLLAILRASIEDPAELFAALVPEEDYRATFLRLTRNLAPTGKTFAQMEVRSLEEPHPITLGPSARKAISKALRSQRPKEDEQAEAKPEAVRGILRALDLERDWLEVIVGDQQVRVHRVGETVDDVIGPMVNRPVVVDTVRDLKGRYSFRDIELDE